VPNLSQAGEVRITARSKDLRSKISDVKATVRVVPTDDPLWDRVATNGLGRRLNLPDGDGAKDRWRDQCTLLELTPEFRKSEAGAPAAGGGKAAAPAAGAKAGGDAPAKAKKAEEDIHVEVQIDQEVFDKLVAEGTSERVARAKAKAAYVRAEKARIRAERGDAA
jgi:hypothetical protein